MIADSDQNYFCYIPEDRLCRTLGCTLQSSGYTRIGRHAQYPAKVHPEGHVFDFRQGRVLRAFQIVYISEGKGRVELGRDKQLCDIQAGQAFVLFPDVWHRYTPDPITGWHEHWIECKGYAFDMAYSSGLLERNRPIFRNPKNTAVEATFKEIHDLAREDAVGNQAVLSMLGLKLLAILTGPRSDSQNSSNRLINTVRMLIQERCAETQKMESFADELNVSYSNLRRSFRASTGMSMKEYQLTVRIHKAKEMLDNSGLTVKEVAGQLGFSSAFHFSSQFSKAVGCPPSAWRSRSIAEQG